MQLLIASRNPQKKAELAAILSDMGWDLLNLNDIADIPEVVEDGDSFNANAVKKAVETARYSAHLSLGDDSGLVVDALDGAPGIYSARFAGKEANDANNNAKLLSLLQEVPDEQRGARFVCAIAVAAPDGRFWTMEGICEGRIGRVADGTSGFGYDPLFIPNGCTGSFATMSAEEKHRISHRGRALQELQRCLPILMAELNSTT